MGFLHLIPLGCDGCWTGWQAVLGLVIAVTVLIGSIYMLLASNFGARLGYLVLMVSLMAWIILLAAMWLFGLPGTTPGTGPTVPQRLVDRLLRRTPPPYSALFRRQVPAIITPRDFDLSPYFEIVKLNGLEAGKFDYRRIKWA